MNIKNEFTRHAYLKLNEREIEESEVIQVLQNPEKILLDTETGNIGFVSDRTAKSVHKLLIVLPEDITKVITLPKIAYRKK